MLNRPYRVIFEVLNAQTAVPDDLSAGWTFKAFLILADDPSLKWIEEKKTVPPVGICSTVLPAMICSFEYRLSLFFRLNSDLLRQARLRPSIPYALIELPIKDSPSSARDINQDIFGPDSVITQRQRPAPPNMSIMEATHT
jgi:hypothetical protein